MDPQAYKDNNKPEKGGQPGVYAHPYVATKMHATNFPQADALLRQGWQWVDELPKDVRVTEGTDNTAAPSAALDVARLEAELAAAKERQSRALEQVEANRESESAQADRDAAEQKERQSRQAELDQRRSKTLEKINEADRNSNDKKESK